MPVKKLPILTTFAKLDGITFVDTTKREEKSADARLSLATLEDGQVCAMQKGGTGTFTDKEVADLFDVAVEKAKELRALIKKA